MKLASCFNKISFSLEDRAEINALVRENGGDESAGVQAYIDGLIADIEDARSQIAEQGFDVALPAEAKQVEEPKVEEPKVEEPKVEEPKVETRNETTAKPEETAKPTPKKAETGTSEKAETGTSEKAKKQDTPDGEDSDTKYQRALDMFYSPLLRALSSAKQKQAPAKDWKAILSKLPGVKKAELEWLGVDEWLDAQDGQVTRDALIEFVRDSQIEIVEVVGGDNPPVDIRFDDTYGVNEAGEQEFTVYDNSLPPNRGRWEAEGSISNDGEYLIELERTYVFDSREQVLDWAESKVSENLPSGSDFEAGFEEYTESGGDNYREVLLRVPNLHNEGKNARARSREAVEADQERLLNGRMAADLSASERAELDALIEENTQARSPKQPFVQSGHFQEENVVVHARVKDRIGPNGEKILFVEEIQSDLASKWREAGVEDAATRTEREAWTEQKADATRRINYLSGEITEKVAAADPDADVSDLNAVNIAHYIHRAFGGFFDASAVAPLREELVVKERVIRRHASEDLDNLVLAYNDKEAANRELLQLGTEKSVDPSLPDTPFKQEHTYTLMVKRLLRLAAEGGYDRLSWTPGYMQAERWNAAAQNVVDGVKWEIAPASTGAAKRVVLGLQGAENVAMVSEAGVVSGAGPVDGKPLSSLLGPELAKRIMSEPSGSVSGQKITFPSSGYSIAYDQQTRKAVNTLAKKSGTQVYEDKTLPDFSDTTKSDEALDDAVMAIGIEAAIEKVKSAYPERWTDGARERATKQINFTTQSGAASDIEKATRLHRKAVSLIGRPAVERVLLSEGASNPVWSVDINENLRASALEPMAILRKGDQPNVDTAKIEALMPEMRKRLDDLQLRKVNLEFTPDMREQGAVKFGRDESITVLIGSALDGMKTVNHEIIHILKAMGLFTKKEWATLEAEAKNVWMAKYDIANRYSDLDEAGQIEEAIAEAFADYAGRAPNNLIQSAMAKIKRFFRALKETLLSNNITDVSDIFSGVDSGRVSRRVRPTVPRSAAAAQASTESVAFNKWFKGSKVVDEAGKPIEVYHHGSFDPESDIPKSFMHFGTVDAATERAFEKYKEDATSAVMTYSVNNKQEWHWQDHDGVSSQDLGLSGYRTEELAQEAGRENVAEVIDNDITLDLEELGGTTSVYLNLKNPMRIKDQGDDWKGAILKAKAKGHDGIVYVNKYEDRGSTSYIAFEPTQIKSLFNRGTFDANDPKILNQRRPSPRTMFQRQLDERASEAVGEPVTHGVIADTPISVRKESMLRAFASQPIDQVIRIPWQLVGGLDSQGAWKPGNKLDDLRQRVSTESRFSENGPFRFMNPLMTRVRAGVVDRFGQSPEYIETDRRRGVYQNMIASQGQEHLQAILNSGASPEEAKVLGAMLAGEPIVDADMLKLAQPIRRAVDDFGSEAVELGMISRESYERNRGSYMHRVYEKHEYDDGAVARWATGLGRKRRKQVIGSQLKGRGPFEEVTPQEMLHSNKAYLSGLRGKVQKGEKYIILDRRMHEGQASLEGLEREAGPVVRRVFWPAQEPIPDALFDYDNRGTFEVRSESKNKVVLWRDYTKEERLRMGEILDARYTVAKTFSLMAEDLATGRFFKDIAENEEWTRSTPPAGAKVDEEARASTLKRLWIDPEMEWVKVPDAKIPKSDAFRYGALAGKYVRAEIWRDMEELRILQTPTWLNKTNTQWKLNKTARAPVTHTNNVMSNFMLMDMADVRMPDLTKGISEMWKGGPLYQEAKANGAFGADFVTQEIQKNVLEPLLKEIRDKERGGKGGFEAQIGHLGWVMDRLYRGLKALDKKMIDVYQFEDQVFRMATYIRRRQQGASIEEAAVEARDQFINYDIRAPWINALRRTGLPFLAYTYRAIPKVAQTALKRPWKLAKYLAIYHALNMLSYTIAPSDDDEETERGSLGEYQEGRTWFGMPHLIRMPWLSEGNPVFLDVKRWIPAGDVFDTNGTDLPAWMHIGGPVVMGLEVYFNKSLFTDKEIVNKVTDTYGERTAKRASYLYKAWMPSHPFIPGSWYNERVFRAAKGEARKWGSNQPYSLREELASAIGLKLKPIDVEVGYKSWEINYDRISRELGYQKSGLKRDRERKLISLEEYNRQLDRIKIKEERVKKERKARKALSR